MIILNFILDYIVMLLLPFNTYFICFDIDKSNRFSVFVVGLLLDIMYHKLFINLFMLLVIYSLVKRLNVSKKYFYLKNIVLFLIYFNVTFFMNGFDISRYLILFIFGIVTYLIYIVIYKMNKI